MEKEINHSTPVIDLDALRQEGARQLNEYLPTPLKKTTYSYAELHQTKDQEQPFLIPELIPQGAVCVLVGEDGIGKTQLCTQLCLCVAFGYDKFLGMNLNARHKRALIVATEDSRQKWIKACTLQSYTMEPAHKPESVLIDFTEASDFDDFAQMKEELEGLLSRNFYDIIIADALSDIFTLIDGEINSNKDARRILSFFQHLCNTYNTTVIVLHHAAKSKVVSRRLEGKVFIEKNDSQGAGAITQKPRTILGLTNDPLSISEDGKTYTNYLHVLKANLMGKLYMTKAIGCTFNTETLLHQPMSLVDIFEFEQQRTPAGSVNQQQSERTVSGKERKLEPKEIEDSIHIARLKDAFKEGVLNRETMLERLRTVYNMGKNKMEEKDGLISYIQQRGWVARNGPLYAFREPYINPGLPKDDDPPF